MHSSFEILFRLRVSERLIELPVGLMIARANTGSVYLFSRSNVHIQATTSAETPIRNQAGYFKLVKMIAPPTNHRIPVSCLSICPRERFLAIGTARGALYAYSLTDVARCGEKTEFTHDFHTVSRSEEKI